MLHEVWSMLNNKYMPSVAVEATKLWIQFEGLRQRGRPMQEHIYECMAVRNRLLAINEPVPDRQYRRHSEWTEDAYAFMHMNNPPRHQHQQGQAGRGRFQRRIPLVLL